MAKKKKVANKKKGGQPEGLWFTKIFTEGSESDSRPRKRRVIERYYEGFLRGYNVGHQSDFEITKFDWSIVSEGTAGTRHQLEVYITPPPIPAPPGGGATTDPPNPTHPPPKMT